MPPYHRALVLFPLLLASVGEPIQAQQGKTGVYVSHVGGDAIGQRLAFLIREELTRSARYSSADLQGSSYTIELISVDLAASESDRGLRSAVAVALTMRNQHKYQKGNPQTWYPIHLNTLVSGLGANRTDTQAKSIVSSLDVAIEEYKKSARDN